MTINETIEQLKDLQKNQQSFICDKNPDPDNPFVLDVAAINNALKFIEGVNNVLTKMAEIKVKMLAEIDKNPTMYNYIIGYCCALSVVEGLTAKFIDE